MVFFLVVKRSHHYEKKGMKENQSMIIGLALHSFVSRALEHEFVEDTETRSLKAIHRDGHEGIAFLSSTLQHSALVTHENAGVLERPSFVNSSI